MEKLIIFFILILSFNQTFWFTKLQEEKIQKWILKESDYKKQILILDKLKLISNLQKDKNFILSIKKEILNKNLKNILIDSFSDYNNKKEIYKKYFGVLQSVDLEASVNPYYFKKLLNKIAEDDIYLKSSIYIFYEIKNNLKNDKSYYSNYKTVILDNINKKENTFDVDLLDRNIFDFLKQEKYNYLSKKDVEKLQNYIVKNHIWPDSKIFQYFLNYKNFLNWINSWKIYLNTDINQKTQEKNLSCEVNSASIFASYFLKKDISEDYVFSKIKKFDKKLEKKWNKYIWGNPYEEFVWDIEWNQTKIIEKMTWYWIYAKPISDVLNSIWVKNKVSVFDKDLIIKSLLENKPVIFWYLHENKLWDLNTNPITWYTNDWKQIKWYIWEHTWIIVWLSFLNNWNIDRVFFYEWKNNNLQSLKYYDLKYQSSFFNSIIIKE